MSEKGNNISGWLKE